MRFFLSKTYNKLTMAKSHKRGKDGKYNIKGKKYNKIRGSRAEVMHGTAFMTTGEVKKDGLKYNKHNRIVSKKLSGRAKREKRLVKSGYVTKKGQFGAFKKIGKTLKAVSKKRNKTQRRRRIK